MRHLALAILILTMLASTSRRALAIGAVVVQANSGYGAPAPGYGGSGHKCGLFQRLCGKHQPACPAPASYGAASETGTVIVADLTRPCYQGGGPGVLFATKGVSPNHCFPNCFIGTPCSCCHHKIRYPHPNSPRGRAYAWRIQNGQAGHVQPIQSPGMAAPLVRKKHFDTP